MSAENVNEIPNDRESHKSDSSTTVRAENRNSVSEEPSQDDPSIFAQRFALFTNEFGRTCEENDVELAIAIIIDPVCPGRPHIFYRGRTYDIAVLTKELLKHLRDQITSELS